MTPLVGALEAGGTKFVCAVGTGPDDLRDEFRIATGSPADTIAEVVEFFRGAQERHGAIDALGIGAFGPVDLHADSPTFGHITTTPKSAWQNTDLGGALGQTLGVPVAFETDVNAAALGEHRWGAAQGLDSFLYLTIGTGIGGGGLVRGRPLHGLVHPEMGHLRIPHDRSRDPFPGRCPYHGDCWEGLAAGPALAARWGAPAESLPPDHAAWPLEAEYLALGLQNLVCVVSPQRVILGGGVMDQAQLFPLVRARLLALLNGYIQAPTLLADVDRFVVPPVLGARAGVLGALALGLDTASTGSP